MIFLIFIAVISLITASVYAFQHKLIFFPEALSQDYVFQFDQTYEELNYKTPDGHSINALLFKVPEAKGIVYYHHGNAGSLRSWGSIAPIFMNHRYNLLIYDYRGFGKSSGKISEKILYQDARLIYQSLLKSYSEDSIVVYGRSIGTGVATKIAEENNPKLLILESPYYNLPDLAKTLLPFIPSAMIRFQLPNNERIPHIKAPIRIFHGTMDEVVYFGSSRKLEKLLTKKDQLIPVEGGGHNNLADFKIYHTELRKILE